MKQKQNLQHEVQELQEEADAGGGIWMETSDGGKAFNCTGCRRGCNEAKTESAARSTRAPFSHTGGREEREREAGVLGQGSGGGGEGESSSGKEGLCCCATCCSGGEKGRNKAGEPAGQEIGRVGNWRRGQPCRL